MDRDWSQALWRLEEQFWRGDADFYRRTLAADALMVLPEPAGILARSATIDAIGSGARWRNVAFEDRRQMPAGSSAGVLAYAVRADRGGPDSAYAALCSSTYVRDDDRWLLVLHQQTPTGQRGDGGD